MTKGVISSRKGGTEHSMTKGVISSRKGGTDHSLSKGKKDKKKQKNNELHNTTQESKV
jgi:hypothetical protein